MPSLYLVRHGEPAITGVLLGRTDPPLSAEGIRQMESIRLPISRIYTSPLRRALDSARILAKGAEVTVVSELAEVSMGEWDGRAWSDIERENPDLAAAKLADWTAVTPPGGEPWAGFRCRIEAALAKILAAGHPTVVVGHIAANACIAAMVGAADPVTFRQGYGEVYEYQF